MLLVVKCYWCLRSWNSLQHILILCHNTNFLPLQRWRVTLWLWSLDVMDIDTLFVNEKHTALTIPRGLGTVVAWRDCYVSEFPQMIEPICETDMCLDKHTYITQVCLKGCLRKDGFNQHRNRVSQRFEMLLCCVQAMITPLHLAVGLQDTPAVKALMKAGCDINTADMVRVYVCFTPAHGRLHMVNLNLVFAEENLCSTLNWTNLA